MSKVKSLINRTSRLLVKFLTTTVTIDQLSPTEPVMSTVLTTKKQCVKDAYHQPNGVEISPSAIFLNFTNTVVPARVRKI